MSGPSFGINELLDVEVLEIDVYAKNTSLASLQVKDLLLVNLRLNGIWLFQSHEKSKLLVFCFGCSFISVKLFELMTLPVESCVVFDGPFDIQKHIIFMHFHILVACTFISVNHHRCIRKQVTLSQRLAQSEWIKQLPLSLKTLA